MAIFHGVVGSNDPLPRAIRKSTLAGCFRLDICALYFSNDVNVLSTAFRSLQTRGADYRSGFEDVFVGVFGWRFFGLKAYGLPAIGSDGPVEGNGDRSVEGAVVFKDAVDEGLGALEDVGLDVEHGWQEALKVVESACLSAERLRQGHVQDDDGVVVEGDGAEEGAIQLCPFHGVDVERGEGCVSVDVEHQ